MRRAFRLFVLVFPLLFGSAVARAQEFDLLVVGGRVVDGSGNPWYRADIGIRAGRIVEIGDLSHRSAKRSVDAKGLLVTPGFIDMMGTDSLPLLRDPESAQSKLRKGITTMLVGEGESPAPQNERSMPPAVRTGGLQTTWRTYDDYFKTLEAKGVALNVVHNVGAAQVRKMVIGEEDRAPTPEELAQMKELVAQAMRDGAIGLSTALIYPPGAYAKTEEIIELAKVVGQHGGIYLSHMRNESAQLLEAIREVIRIGEEARLPVHIFHLKAAGQENWPLMKQALNMIAEARSRGIDVTADIYPYIRNGIGLSSFLHPRHYAAGRASFLRTLGDQKVRAALRREMETTSDWENWYRHVGKNWDNVLVCWAPPGVDRELEGRSIKEIASTRAVDPWKVFFDFVQQHELGVCPKSMNEEQKREALRAEFVSVCTDAPPANPATTTATHPRAFGAFPRILAQYVRTDKVVSLEGAVRQMTSLAANALKLWDRGRIAAGMAADLVIFDPAKVMDTATFAKPISYPVGIEYVVVNGQVAVERGQSAGAPAGKVLRFRP